MADRGFDDWNSSLSGKGFNNRMEIGESWARNPLEHHGKKLLDAPPTPCICPLT